MRKTYLKLGAWNSVCDVCGFRFKSTDLKKRWDGLMVCKKDWEPRHPQDLIRIRGETAFPSWTRPEPTDTFTNIVYACTPEGTSAIVRYAVVGCSRVGSTIGQPLPYSGAVVGRAVVGRAIVGKT